MQFNQPLGYHLTFTTRGTWLHGDERGSIHRGHSGQPSQFVAPDAATREAFESMRKHPVVKLDAKSRRVVRESVEEHCRFKTWPLLALNVRTNHVHVVVAAADAASKMLHSIKARATRKLREAQLFPPDNPVWTERGSKKHLYTREALERAIRYVELMQGPDLPEE